MPLPASTIGRTFSVARVGAEVGPTGAVIFARASRSAGSMPFGPDQHADMAEGLGDLDEVGIASM